MNSLCQSLSEGRTANITIVCIRKENRTTLTHTHTHLSCSVYLVGLFCLCKTVVSMYFQPPDMKVRKNHGPYHYFNFTCLTQYFSLSTDKETYVWVLETQENSSTFYSIHETGIFVCFFHVVEVVFDAQLLR